MESKLKFLKNLSLLLFFSIGLSISSCKNDTAEKPSVAEKVKKPRVKVPKFNADTAYYFIEKQLSFGNRIPGTPEANAARAWMVSKFKQYGASVKEQSFKADFLGKKNVASTNIIASFNENKKQRVLLCAHWDSRLIAEKDPDKEKQDDPIPGADDGASGTAALIEIARIISDNPIDLGIDIVLFDTEDQGSSNDTKSWAKGSQYFSSNPHKKGYKADFGILLDMIAGKGARFPKEGYSRQYAPAQTNKIWKLAQNMGNGHLFQDVSVGGITDDHYYVNTILGIPTVDIINMPAGATGTFGEYHHTHSDDISNIDKRNLKSVGQVVLAVIYKTSDNSL